MKFLPLQHVYHGSFFLQHEAFSCVFLPVQSFFDLHPELFENWFGSTQLLNVHQFQFLKNISAKLDENFIKVSILNNLKKKKLKKKYHEIVKTIKIIAQIWCSK